MKNFFSKKYPFAILAVILTLGIASFGEYQYYILKNHSNELELNLKNTLDELTNVKNENATLTATLSSEKNRNDEFQSQISTISGTVGVLEKIKNTDIQLLQKYSKVYFLNENYTPSSLADIEASYLYEKTKPLKIHAKVWPHLEQMLNEASSSQIKLSVVSAYRSYGEQTAVKTSYKVLYGSGANKFSADQGYSEHQLGTTVDLDEKNSNKTLQISFEKTKAYQWLKDNAYKYGFIISYPKQNTFYQFEPWHWRYVGIELAKKLHDDGTYFYQVDQREINKFLANFFD